jgi:hypothetical protein
MNPIKTAATPARDLARAVTTTFNALFVIALTGTINFMTSPGHWWFQWVALGMGIAVVVAWARALRWIALGALAYAGYRWLKRRGERA